MTRTASHPRAARRAFTLLELLVVMGILLVLATLTVISVGKVTRDAKLANATNTVVSALGTARAIAIRDNAYVMVTFRVAPDRRGRRIPRTPQVIQVITARWTGEVVTPEAPLPAGVEMPSTADVYGQRFLPVPGVPARDLPSGVYVAGPGFFRVSSTSTGLSDKYWFTQPVFAGTADLNATPPTYVPNLALTEVGNTIGVMFGPDGRAVSRMDNDVTEVDNVGSSDGNAWVKPFLDTDGNGFPSRGTSVFSSFPPLQNVSFFYYDEPLDDGFVDLVPYLAVFNMSEARERFNSSLWKGPNIGNLGSFNSSGTFTEPVIPQRVKDISNFVDEQADRITFNRYTGVPGIISK
jgi:prepilin-type N-terminal cleavage/methylation domain-containing protein